MLSNRGTCCCCRQAEALRLLYHEELARASKLAVELTKTTAAVDKVGPSQAGWPHRQQHSASVSVCNICVSRPVDGFVRAQRFEQG